MYPLYKLLALLICAVLEGGFGSKKTEPKVKKEDDAETKWRRWRIQRDEELETRRRATIQKPTQSLPEAGSRD